MKTVMKRIFSLMLVAVMLVSAVPVAFAEEASGVTCRECGKPAVMNVPNYKAATCTTNRQDAYKCTDEACRLVDGFAVTIEGTALGHTAGDAATCLDPQICTVCSETLVAAKGHTAGAAANCSTPQTCTVCSAVLAPATDDTDAAKHVWNEGVITTQPTCTQPGVKTFTCTLNANHTPKTEPVAATGHNPTEGVCTTCGYCSDCQGTNGNHTDDCDRNPYKVKTCANCLRTYKDADGAHICCETCKAINHTTSDHCTECNRTDGKHNTGCSKYISTGSSTVKIHVNLYTSNTYTATKELVVYNDSSADTIYYSVAEHKALIENELAKQYPKYTWYGNVYEAIKGDDGVEMSETIGNGVTVYINAYSAEAMVLISVHNTRTMAPLNDSFIQLHGKMLGETVTKSEVLKAISKNYSVSNMWMYSEQAWEDYVSGKTVKDVESLKITTSANHEPFYIDVYINGYAKTGSSGSGYTADSSNPKTGDTIFAPVAVMGLSVSALAVLFFLNKKRAY